MINERSTSMDGSENGDVNEILGDGIKRLQTKDDENDQGGDNTTTTTTTTSYQVKRELQDTNSPEFIEEQLQKQGIQDYQYQQQNNINNNNNVNSNVNNNNNIGIKKCKDDFESIRKIGQGSYGKVKLVVEKSTGNLYASKILNKHLIIKEKKAKYVKTEKTILDSLNHFNIVKLYYTFQDETNLYFILEYCSNGDLLDHLKTSGCFQLHVARFYAAEILLALEYLHSQGIAHRDLKPENCLLSKSMHVKLSDFGSAKVLGKELGRSGSFCGTAEYVCPELLTEKSAGVEADIWAFGCILFQMISGKLPFKGFNEYQTFQLIIKRDIVFPPSFDPKAQQLINRILTLDPASRPTIQEIKNHPFFEPIDWSKVQSMEPPQIIPQEPQSPPVIIEDHRQRSQSQPLRNLNQSLSNTSTTNTTTSNLLSSSSSSPIQIMNSQSGNQWKSVHHNPQQRERSITSTSQRQSPISSTPSSPIPSSNSTFSPIIMNNDVNNNNNNNSPDQLILSPKSNQPIIYISPSELFTDGASQINHLREVQKNLVWNNFLLPNNEIIIGMTPIEKRTGLISKKRHLLITSTPRIFWVDPHKMVVKGELPIDLSLVATVKSKKHFHVTTKGRTRHFYDIISQDSQKWVDLINDPTLKMFGSFSN